MCHCDVRKQSQDFCVREACPKDIYVAVTRNDAVNLLLRKSYVIITKYIGFLGVRRRGAACPQISGFLILTFELQSVFKIVIVTTVVC